MSATQRTHRSWNVQFRRRRSWARSGRPSAAAPRGGARRCGGTRTCARRSCGCPGSWTRGSRSRRRCGSLWRRREALHNDPLCSVRHKGGSEGPGHFSVPRFKVDPKDIRSTCSRTQHALFIRSLEKFCKASIILGIGTRQPRECDHSRAPSSPTPIPTGSQPCPPSSRLLPLPPCASFPSPNPPPSQPSPPLVPCPTQPHLSSACLPARPSVIPTPNIQRVPTSSSPRPVPHRAASWRACAASCRWRRSRT